MKKRILGATLLVATAVAAGWNFNQSRNEVSNTCFWNCTFDYNYQCHVFGPGTMGPTYCFYYRAR